MIRSFYTLAGELWKMTAFQRALTFIRARARDIIVKYFISSDRVIFHEKIQFYILLFRFIPLLLVSHKKFV